jgi:hypothetical protein
MFGLTALNAEMADCWKLVWNVEPAALMVPLAVLVLALDEVPVAAEAPLDVEDEEDELDEEHAARTRAAATADTPTVATRCLRPSGISGTPYR